MALADHLGLSPTLVEDVMAPLERPKVTRHADHMFFMAYATSMSAGTAADGSSRLRMSRISGLVFKGAS